MARLDPLLALASKDRQLVRAATEVRELVERRDWKLEGYLVVHDGDCAHPQGPCDCTPIELLTRR